MNITESFRNAVQSRPRKTLPILGFPAATKLGITIEELVHSAELQAKAMELIAKETDTIAAVSLMDLSVEADAFGAQIRFSANEIPAVTGQLVADEDDAMNLRVPDVTRSRTAIPIEAIRLAKERITDKPVLGGIIGPFSLAGRLMDVTEIMYTCYDDPDVVKIVLDKATDFLISYGTAMKAAGADGILMAEPLAGILTPALMAEFSMPYVTRIVDAFRAIDLEVIYHNCGNAVTKMLKEIFSQNAFAYHFGDAVDMEDVLKESPENKICMGNISPSDQFVQGTPASMTTAVTALLKRCGKYSNFMISSGCDIPAHSPWNNIDAYFAAVANFTD